MKNVSKLMKFLFEQNQSLTVYVDQDGVLANFDGAIQQNQEMEFAKSQLISSLEQFPELRELDEDDLKKVLSGEQKDPLKKALKKALQKVSAIRYKIAGEKGFFLNLEPFSDARELLVGCYELTGKRPHILTAPVTTNSEQCENEKREWMYDKFNGLFDEFICNAQKASFANSNSVLIDDREKYTIPFSQAGGNAILHTSAKDSLSKLRELLNK